MPSVLLRRGGNELKPAAGRAYLTAGAGAEAAQRLVIRKAEPRGLRGRRARAVKGIRVSGDVNYGSPPTLVPEGQPDPATGAAGARWGGSAGGLPRPAVSAKACAAMNNHATRTGRKL